MAYYICVCFSDAFLIRQALAELFFTFKDQGIVFSLPLFLFFQTKHVQMKRADRKKPTHIRGGILLKSLWHYTCGHKAKDTTPLIAWRREGIARGSSQQRSSLRGRERAIVNQTNIRTVSRATLGKLLRDGEERTRAFPSA